MSSKWAFADIADYILNALPQWCTKIARLAKCS